MVTGDAHRSPDRVANRTNPLTLSSNICCIYIDVRCYIVTTRMLILEDNYIANLLQHIYGTTPMLRRYTNEKGGFAWVVLGLQFRWLAITC
jgi:hypothetical protein